MDLLFKPEEGTTIRISSRQGSWFALLTTITEITCSHGSTHRLDLEYRREFTAEDEGALLTAFETVLRAQVASTFEHKIRVSTGVKELVAMLTDECIYESFTDPCLIPET